MSAPLTLPALTIIGVIAKPTERTIKITASHHARNLPPITTALLLNKLVKSVLIMDGLGCSVAVLTFFGLTAFACD